MQCSFANIWGVRLLWYSILCPKGPLEEWFRFDCIFGKCKDYGVKSLKLCPHKIYVNGQLMQWKCFQKVSAGLTRAREGKKGHKTRKFWNLAIKLGYKSRERWLLEEGNKKCCVKKDKLLCVNHMSALIQFLEEVVRFHLERIHTNIAQECLHVWQVLYNFWQLPKVWSMIFQSNLLSSVMDLWFCMGTLDPSSNNILACILDAIWVILATCGSNLPCGLWLKHVIQVSQQLFVALENKVFQSSMS